MGERYKLVVFLTVLLGATVAQGAEPRSEIEVKAAFLFQFSRFVDWPVDAFESDASPIVIGILGDEQLAAVFTKIVADKTVSGRPVTVETYTADRDALHCHILFIGSTQRSRLEELAALLRGSHVFSFADSEGFAELGGVGNFVMSGKKVRFQINAGAARRAGLKISSRLLDLAQPFE